MEAPNKTQNKSWIEFQGTREFGSGVGLVTQLVYQLIRCLAKDCHPQQWSWKLPPNSPSWVISFCLVGSDGTMESSQTLRLERMRSRVWGENSLPPLHQRTRTLKQWALGFVDRKRAHQALLTVPSAAPLPKIRPGSPALQCSELSTGTRAGGESWPC